jgi:hypothetical protein
VTGNVNSGSYIKINNIISNTWGSVLNFNNTRYIEVVGGAEYTNRFQVGPGGVSIGDTYNPPIYDLNGTVGLTVEKNVGIGTTNPGATLDVNGRIAVTGGTSFARASTSGGIGSYTRTVTLTGGENGGGIELTITGWGASGGGWSVYKIIFYGALAISNGFNLSGTTVISNTFGFAPLFTIASVNNPSDGTYTVVLTGTTPGSYYINAAIISYGYTAATISIA